MGPVLMFRKCSVHITKLSTGLTRCGHTCNYFTPCASGNLSDLNVIADQYG